MRLSYLMLTGFITCVTLILVTPVFASYVHFYRPAWLSTHAVVLTAFGTVGILLVFGSAFLNGSIRELENELELERSRAMRQVVIKQQEIRALIRDLKQRMANADNNEFATKEIAAATQKARISMLMDVIDWAVVIGFDEKELME